MYQERRRTSWTWQAETIAEKICGETGSLCGKIEDVYKTAAYLWKTEQICQDRYGCQVHEAKERCYAKC